MNFQTIGIRELWNMICRPDVYIIDLRELSEYQKFHIEGAHHYPFEQMNQWKDTLPRDKCLLLYCEYGGTSMIAAKRLGRMGYHVYTLVGGMNALNG